MYTGFVQQRIQSLTGQYFVLVNNPQPVYTGYEQNGEMPPPRDCLELRIASNLDELQSIVERLHNERKEFKAFKAQELKVSVETKVDVSIRE